MKSLEHPLFSIITVTYNAQDTIATTLKSVASQSCQLYEHIIMDGASTDGTMEIVNSFDNDKKVVDSKPDKGIYYAMNDAMAIARGEYLIFMNSGDRFHSSDTLQRIADAIFNNDFPGIVYGQTNIVDKDGNTLGPRHLKAPEKLSLQSFKDGMVVCHQAFIPLRKIAGYYNHKYRFSSDYEWCIICLQHSKKNVYIPDVIVDYLNEGLTTQNHKQSLKERFKIMSTYFGFFSTCIFHIKFLSRYLKRRKNAVNNQ